MPVREKAAQFLAHRALPNVWFSYGEPSDRRWDKVKREQDETYAALVNTIDWNRVLLDAWGRHMAFWHGEPEGPEQHRDDDRDAPCGECVQAALLATDRDTDWKAQAATGDRGQEGLVIRYEDLIVGSLWLDPDGRVWALDRRGARNHYNVMVRPDLLGKDYRGIGLGRLGQHYQLVTDYHMNLNGWRRA